MCLAIPGKVVVVFDKGQLCRSGRIDFGGIERIVNLAAVPEAVIGDYVLVHAGLAISVLDPNEAEMTLNLISAIDDDDIDRSVR